MSSKKDRVLRRIRIVIDVINVILSVAVIGVVVYTFLDVSERMEYFPHIFYGGASVNAITGIKHMISEKKLQGLAAWIFGAVLIAAGWFCSTIVGGIH